MVLGFKVMNDAYTNLIFSLTLQRDEPAACDGAQVGCREERECAEE